jgi:hypothetical protein
MNVKLRVMTPERQAEQRLADDRKDPERRRGGCKVLMPGIKFRMACHGNAAKSEGQHMQGGKRAMSVVVWIALCFSAVSLIGLFALRCWMMADVRAFRKKRREMRERIDRGARRTDGK